MQSAALRKFISSKLSVAHSFNVMKSACIHFLMGSCRFGTSCRFSHHTRPQALPFEDREKTGSKPIHEENPTLSFKVMSYNILADSLAKDHARELYSSMPHFALDWRYRHKLITQEIRHHLPEIVCLQEVDRRKDMDKSLEELGYAGCWTKRTGDRRDGLAMYWRQDAFHQVKSDYIKFVQLGLRDNVSQIILLESRNNKKYRIIVGNIHVLFNPKRGDIKLAQVRTMLERIEHMQAEEQHKPPAIICGDFNSAAGSAIHDFVLAGELDLSQCDRRSLSGQIEGRSKGWMALKEQFLTSQEVPYNPAQTWEIAREYDQVGMTINRNKKMRDWNPAELGIVGASSKEMTVRHPLKVASAYGHVAGSEPAFSTFHDGYLGTVDYIFFTRGSPQDKLSLMPCSVLQPPPLESLSSGLPSAEWPSDHVSLLAEFQLSER